MSVLENNMKIKGENKVWKDIIDKKGRSKHISSSQVGQKLLIDEAIRIFPEFRGWVSNGSGSKDRAALKEYFSTDEIIEEKN